MNNVRQPFDPSLLPASQTLRKANNNAEKPFLDLSANRNRRLGTNFRRYNGKATSLTAEQFKPPTFHSQRQNISINSSNKNPSTSQPTNNFAQILSKQNAVASSSTISDSCFNDAGETEVSRADCFTPHSMSQNWFNEDPHQDEMGDNDVSRRSQSARVVYERNAEGSKQTRLCFKPVETPARKANMHPRALNQMNRRVDSSIERTPIIRPMPMHSSRTTPLPQDMSWLDMQKAYRHSIMQQYNFDPSQEGLYYHGQKISGHIVDRELRAQAAAADTKPKSSSSAAQARSAAPSSTRSSPHPASTSCTR